MNLQKRKKKFTSFASACVTFDLKQNKTKKVIFNSFPTFPISHKRTDQHLPVCRLDRRPFAPSKVSPIPKPEYSIHELN